MVSIQNLFILTLILGQILIFQIRTSLTIFKNEYVGHFKTAPTTTTTTTTTPTMPSTTPTTTTTTTTPTTTPSTGNQTNQQLPCILLIDRLIWNSYLFLT